MFARSSEDKMTSSEAILTKYIECRRNGRIDVKLYAPDIVLLTSFGKFKGHEGVNHLGDLLLRQLPDSEFEVGNQLIQDDYVFLEWQAGSRDSVVRDGADSFVIRDGKIAFQTVHYTLEKEAV